MAATTTLTYARGEEDNRRWEARDEDGALIDLTGYLMFFTVRDGPTEDDALVFELTSAGGEIVYDADQPGVGKGLGQWEFRTVHTLQPAGEDGIYYYWDCWVTAPDTLDRVAHVRGRFLITPRISTVAA
jgi:hypothetical protein